MTGFVVRQAGTVVPRLPGASLGWWQAQTQVVYDKTERECLASLRLAGRRRPAARRDQPPARPQVHRGHRSRVRGHSARGRRGRGRSSGPYFEDFTDGDGWVEFDKGVEGDGITVEGAHDGVPGAMTFSLRWDDWQTRQRDLDLIITNSPKSPSPDNIVAQSSRPQGDGTANP